MVEQATKNISRELKLDSTAVQNTLQLLSDGSSIPFIARYRKEQTMGLDEVEIASIRDAYKRFNELEKRRESILKSLSEQSVTNKELMVKINQAPDLATLEDLYLPYKPKRKTRASVAREKGLEPLARMIMAQNIPDFEFKADRMIGRNGVEDLEDAIAGARDIIAEWISERVHIRSSLRRLFQTQADLVSKKVPTVEDEKNTYQNYYDWSEKVKRLPSHRVLAMFRGEREGILKLKLRPLEDKAMELILRGVLRHPSVTEDIIEKAAADSYKRLILPSLEAELRKELKEQADQKAIKVFAENLRQEVILGNLLHQTVEEVWNSPKARDIRNAALIKHKKECNRCAYLDLCGSYCIAEMYLKFGNLSPPREYFKMCKKAYGKFTFNNFSHHG